jgi:NAD(P)-dependent dehydrogenase (short-subunit alcohol dehydrogenase family)
MHFRRRPLQTLTMPVIVITGANSGIGLELCKQLTARGDVVYATCRTPSAELQAVGVTGGIVTGIDVTKTSATELLQKAMRGVSIDVLINNAGGMGSKPGLTWEQQSESQKFATLDIDTLSIAFEVNVVGVVRVSRALVGLMTPGTGKIVIISSLMGSISDNTSGGLMAYRCSKTAVNSVGVTMAQEMRGKKIAVGMVHPGMLRTSFGGGEPPAKMKKFFKPVEGGARGVVHAMDALTMETTGSFMHGNYGEGIKPCPW